jgi:hypothetical protein
MILKPLALALALCVSGPAMAATCTSTFSLGTLTDIKFFGQSFSEADSFNDCYTFTLDLAPISATTATVEWDWSERLDIELTSITLSGGTLIDSSVGLFNAQWLTFTNLTAGDYTLSVAGNVYDRGGVDTTSVKYGGFISTSGKMVTPVPEPESFAMLLLGLGVVTWASRRRT